MQQAPTIRHLATRNLGAHLSSIFELPKVSQGVCGSPGPSGIRNFRGAPAGRPVSYMMCLLHAGWAGEAGALLLKSKSPKVLGGKNDTLLD